MRTSTISRIKQSYGTKEYQDRADSFGCRFWYRPISFYMSIPFVWIGCSANQVTLLRVPIAVLGTVLIVTGTWINTLTGCCLYALCTLLDYVDGNIARLYGSANEKGAFLDALVHVLERSLLPISVAVGLCFRRDRLLTHSAVNSHWIFFLGLFGSIAAFARTFVSLLNLKYCQLAPDNSLPLGGNAQTYGTVGIIQKSKRLLRRLTTESAYFFDAVGVVLFAALNLLSIFLLIVAAQNVFFFRDEWGVLRSGRLR